MIKPLAKTLVIGAKGFLGKHLFHFYRKHCAHTIGTHHHPYAGLWTLHLEDPIPCLLELPLEDYQYALIAGGISSPKRCEADPSASYAVNVDGISSVCKFFLDRSITPIILSSSYVFDGQKGYYLETDAPAPINAYGAQKAALEKIILRHCGDRCLIVRVAKVYGMDQGDGTLINEMASLLAKNQSVLAASDQLLSPISIHDLVQGIILLQNGGCRGIYHLSGHEQVNRYELACAIAKEMGVSPLLIQEISLDDLPSSFRTPKKSNLISIKMQSDTRIQLSPLIENIKVITRHYLSTVSTTSHVVNDPIPSIDRG